MTIKYFYLVLMVMLCTADFTLARSSRGHSKNIALDRKTLVEAWLLLDGIKPILGDQDKEEYRSGELRVYGESLDEVPIEINLNDVKPKTPPSDDPDIPEPALMEAAPDWDLEDESSGDPLSQEAAVQDVLDSTLDFDPSISTGRKLLSLVGSPTSSWSKERTVSFLLAAVMHVLESPGVSNRHCSGGSLGSVRHHLLDALSLIKNQRFNSAKISALQASKILKKCRVHLVNGKRVRGLDSRHLNMAIEDGLQKIALLLDNLEALHDVSTSSLFSQ